MIRKRFTYRLAFIVLLLCSANALFAQSCQKNMLVLSDGDSYAVSNLPKSMPNGALTLECWANVGSLQSNAGLIEYGDANDTGSFSLRMGGGQFFVVTLRTDVGIITVASPSVSDLVSKWHHFAMNFSPNDSIRLFLDGKQVSAKATTASSLVGQWNSLFIGHSGSSAINFIGAIDEVRIWNVARTWAEIAASIVSPLGGTEPGLAAYYPFDDDPNAPALHNFTSKGSELSKISGAILDVSTSPVEGAPMSGYMLDSKEKSILFSDLICSDKATSVINIYNRGAQEVSIGTIGFIHGIVFSATSSAGFPLTGGDSTKLAQIFIQANVSAPGVYRDTLIVSASTICGGLIRIPVQIKKEILRVAFDNPTFELGTLLQCKLPREAQTTLRNTGTKEVTIQSLSFPVGTPITILSPNTPFKIPAGGKQEIKLRIRSVPPQKIDAALSAITGECPVVTKILFKGDIVAQSFTVTPQIIFPPINLPVAPLQLDTTIYFKNTGSTFLSFSTPITLIGSNNFHLVSPAAGLALIRPDSTLAIRIRFTGSECGIYQTLVHLEHLANDIDCGFDTMIPISVDIRGPKISTVSESFDLGAGCTIRDTLITFTNNSGRTVLLGKPSFSDQSISLKQSGDLPRQLNDGDSVQIPFRFAPTTPGEYTTVVTMALTPCGDKTILFHSTYGVGKILASDSVIDFNNGCSLAPEDKIITIENQTGRLITVTDTSSMLSNAFTIVSPSLPFVIADGAKQQIRVRFAPTTLGAARSQITLFENGCYITRIVSKAIREIASISSEPDQAIEFGMICPKDSSTKFLLLKNNGLGEVSISSVRIGGSSAFSAIQPSGAIIGGSSFHSVPFVFIPKDTGEFVAIAEIIFAPCNDTLTYFLHGFGGPAANLIATTPILDFTAVKIGEHDTLCVTISNPSCLAIPLFDTSFSFLHSPFSYSPQLFSALPIGVSDSSSVEVCFIFSPTASGQVSQLDTIVSGDQRIILELRGKGIQSDLRFPKIVDFGDVPRGNRKKKLLTIANSSDAKAFVFSGAAPTGDFKLTDSINEIAGRQIVSDSIEFAPTFFGVQNAVLIFLWDSHSDTVLLRGRGTGPGPLFSVSSIDFSTVRINHDSSITIGVTAPPDSQITITSISIAPPFTVSPLGSAFIARDSTKYYTIKYSPNAEQVDLQTLRISSATASDAVLDVHGQGVEAHLKITPDSLNFGDVALRSTAKNLSIQIENTGGYPLTLTSASLQSSVFSLVPNPMSDNPIAPHSFNSYQVQFLPQRAQLYRDTIRLSFDAPESPSTIGLQGKGVFAPLGIAQLTYSLPNIQARVGDIVSLPIELGGTDIDLVDIDTISIDIRSNPLVVFFHDSIITNGSLSENGWKFSLTRHPTDSTIHIRGKGPTLAHISGVLCFLRAEALLGPIDSSSLIIAASDPINSATILASQGSFVVTDCGNYRGGIILKGNYSISAPKPNPVSDIVNIDYELGLAAAVRIELFDQMGRKIRTLLNADRGIGRHTLQVQLGDLPSGEYYYRIESLEYQSGEKLIINH